MLLTQNRQTYVNLFERYIQSLKVRAALNQQFARTAQQSHMVLH